MSASEKTTHFGRAGEYAAMSELLLRGWNVAVPVVDIGDDVFVINDNDKTTFRVQVKSAYAMLVEQNVWTASFNLSRAQLRAQQQVELFYMLMVRIDACWRFLVIPRQRLFDIHDAHVSAPPGGRGRPPKTHDAASTDGLSLEVRSDRGDITAWRQSLQEYFDAWPETLPLLDAGPGTRRRRS